MPSWTVDERIDAKEREGFITKPFTQEERELARNIAAAWLFVWIQQELPVRCLEERDGELTDEINAIDMGIIRVRQIRGDVR